MHNKTGPPSVQNLLHWKPTPKFLTFWQNWNWKNQAVKDSSGSNQLVSICGICDAIFSRKWSLWRLSMAVIAMTMCFLSCIASGVRAKFYQCPSVTHQMGLWTIHCLRKSKDESWRLSNDECLLKNDGDYAIQKGQRLDFHLRGVVSLDMISPAWKFSESEWTRGLAKNKIQIQNASKYRPRESLRVNELAHLDLLMRRAPAFSPASPQSIFHVQ